MIKFSDHISISSHWVYAGEALARQQPHSGLVVQFDCIRLGAQSDCIPDLRTPHPDPAEVEFSHFHSFSSSAAQVPLTVISFSVQEGFPPSKWSECCMFEKAAVPPNASAGFLRRYHGVGFPRPARPRREERPMRHTHKPRRKVPPCQLA